MWFVKFIASVTFTDDEDEEEDDDERDEGIESLSDEAEESMVIDKAKKIPDIANNASDSESSDGSSDSDSEEEDVDEGLKAAVKAALGTAAADSDDEEKVSSCPPVIWPSCMVEDCGHIRQVACGDRENQNILIVAHVCHM